MKTNGRVTFVSISGEHYDPNLGMTVPGIRTETLSNCSITPVSKAIQFVEYGTRDQDLITIALLQRIVDNFDYALVTSGSLGLLNAKFYLVESITFSPKQVFRMRRG